MTMLTLTTGTALIMWLGEQISEKGIGNGISLIIFAGIVVRLPSAVVSSYTLIATGELKLFVFIGLVAMMVLVTAAVIVMQEGQRKIPVQYAKRMVGRRMAMGQTTHIPAHQHGGRHPGHLRLVADPVPGDADALHPASVDAGDLRGALAWARDVHALYCALIIFFTYLHGHRLQPDRPGRQRMKKYAAPSGVRPARRRPSTSTGC
jgi:preprotein translocase subunit SecY